MFEGKHYKATQKLTVPDVAKRIRTDIARKRSQQSITPMASYSVTSDPGAIRIVVKGRPDSWVFETDDQAVRRYSTDAERLHRQLAEVANAYNYEKDEECRFHLSVDFQSDAEAAREKAEKYRRDMEKTIKEAEDGGRLAYKPSADGQAVYLDGRLLGRIGFTKLEHEDAPWHGTQSEPGSTTEWFPDRIAAVFHVVKKRENKPPAAPPVASSKPRTEAPKVTFSAPEPSAPPATPPSPLSGPVTVYESSTVDAAPEKVIVIEHTRVLGTIVRNTVFPDGSRYVLRKHGWEWDKKGGIWHNDDTVDQVADRPLIGRITAALETLDLAVRVIIDDHPTVLVKTAPISTPAPKVIPAVQVATDPVRPAHVVGTGNRLARAVADAKTPIAEPRSDGEPEEWRLIQRIAQLEERADRVRKAAALMAPVDLAEAAWFKREAMIYDEEIADLQAALNAVDEQAPVWLPEHFQPGDLVSKAGEWMRVTSVHPDGLHVIALTSSNTYRPAYDSIRGRMRDGVVETWPPAPQPVKPDEPMANVFIVSAGKNPTKARCLYRVSVADARKICSDPRTAGRSFGLHYTSADIDSTLLYSWGHDDGRYDELLKELGVRLHPTPEQH